MIRYSYLWLSEHRRGLEEGMKDRPCAVVLSVTGAADVQTVVVLPITHAAPLDPSLAMELPGAVKRHLGLDDARSWVVLSEANRFTWPGPDLRPARPGDAGSVAFGQLPYRFFEQIRLGFLKALRDRRTGFVSRSE